MKRFVATLQNLYQRRAAKAMFADWSPLYETEVAENKYSAANAVALTAIQSLGRSGTQNPVIIDAGIGTGLLAQQIHDALPCRITGLDFTQDMMAVCAAREITELLIKCDVGKDDWPVASASADMVMSAGLLEYLTPDMAVHFLRESMRVLKPGGALVFTYLPRGEKERDIKIWRGHSGTYLTCGYKPDVMEQILKTTGFILTDHSEPFRGCLFWNGSSYDYRLVFAKKP